MSRCVATPGINLKFRPDLALELRIPYRLGFENIHYSRGHRCNGSVRIAAAISTDRHLHNLLPYATFVVSSLEGLRNDWFFLSHTAVLMTDTSKLRCAVKVKARLAELTPRRQEIIRPILEQPRDYILLSIRAAAEKLNTDSAFLLRVVQQIGFPGYADFKRYLHELDLASATSLDRLREGSSRSSSITGVLQASIDRNIQSLVALQNTLDIERITRLARRLHTARRILIIGGDLASTIVDYIEYQLTVLGLPVAAPKGEGRIIHNIRTVDKRDLLLALSFRRGLRSTVEAIKESRAKGAYCVGITNTLISPVASFSNESFVVGIEGESLRSSYVAPMALADVLISASANVRRRRTMKLLGEASEEQKHGFRWYSDLLG